MVESGVEIHVFHRVEGRLPEGEGCGALCCERIHRLPDRSVEFVGQNDPVDDPEVGRLFSAETPAGQHHLEKRSSRNEGAKHRRDHHGPEADADLGCTERGMLGSDRYVASRDKTEPSAECMAVDAADHRFGTPTHPTHQVGECTPLAVTDQRCVDETSR